MSDCMAKVSCYGDIGQCPLCNLHMFLQPTCLRVFPFDIILAYNRAVGKKYVKGCKEGVIGGFTNLCHWSHLDLLQSWWQSLPTGSGLGWLQGERSSSSATSYLLGEEGIELHSRWPRLQQLEERLVLWSSSEESGVPSADDDTSSEFGGTRKNACLPQRTQSGQEDTIRCLVDVARTLRRFLLHLFARAESSRGAIQVQRDDGRILLSFLTRSESLDARLSHSLI